MTRRQEPTRQEREEKNGKQQWKAQREHERGQQRGKAIQGGRDREATQKERYGKEQT